MFREGADSEVDLANADFRFTAESGLNSDIATCPLCAKEVAVSFDTSANNSTDAEMGMPGACADSVFRTRRGLNPLFNYVPE
jgi:hypothetical protein